MARTSAGDPEEHGRASGRRTEDGARGSSRPCAVGGILSDGALLATASRDHDVRIWDGTTGEGLRPLQHNSEVRDASFSPDGRWLVSAAAFRAALWDPRSGLIVVRLQGHEGPVTAALFDESGRRVVTGGVDGIVRTYDCDVCGDLRRVARDCGSPARGHRPRAHARGAQALPRLAPRREPGPEVRGMREVVGSRWISRVEVEGAGCEDLRSRARLVVRHLRCAARTEEFGISASTWTLCGDDLASWSISPLPARGGSPRAGWCRRRSIRRPARAARSTAAVEPCRSQGTERRPEQPRAGPDHARALSS